MADTHSPLHQLADIIEPSVQLGFNLPPLVWLLLALLCLGLIYWAWRRYQRWRFFAAKREALLLLTELAARPDSASQINQLLKRVLQHYQAAHPALTLPVAQWQHWLATVYQAPLPNLNLLLYSKTPDQTASQQFYHFAIQWLHHYDGKAPTAPVMTNNTTGGQHA